jgi:proline iminopeptidase
MSKLGLFRIARRTSLAVLGLVVLLVLGGLATRWWMQSQTAAARPVIDKKVGVDELFYEQIGGISQAFHVRGAKRDLPLLLYVHGGPGTPMMPFSHLFQSTWEAHYIVAQWDQRLSGKTFNANDPAPLLVSTNFEVMKNDTIAAIELLCKRYGKRQVVLVGHSWGSMLADTVARERPDLVAAYVGSGVVIDITANEKLGFELTLAQAQKEGRSDLVAKLEALKPYPTTTPVQASDGNKADALRDVQSQLGVGVTRLHRDDVDTVLLKHALRSPEYTWRDINYFRLDEAQRTSPALRATMYSFDARANTQPMTVPVLFLLGRWDYQTPSSLAVAYFNELSSANKRMVWLENSAHSPMVDEPQAFGTALINNLAELLAKPQPPQAPADR